MNRQAFRPIALVLMMVPMTACVTNKVTGKRDFNIVSESSEIAMGTKSYAPARQQQGGDYNVDPEVVAYVKKVGQKMAAVSDRKLPYEFEVINSSVPNAWAMPGGKISINRGLLVELSSEAELAAVLGHEVTHAAASHSAQAMSRAQVGQIGLMAGSIYVQSQGYKYGNQALQGAQLGMQLISTRYGREAERESDFHGMKYMARAGYDPKAAIDLQQTFVRLSKGRRQDFISGLFASHPPSQERVENNKKTAATLPKGGYMGRERYQQMMARLQRTRQGYEAHDKARKALQEGNTSQALSLVQQALRAEPKEALFHELRGEVRLKQKRYKDAITNFNRAINYNPSFFAGHVGRGVAKIQAGDHNGGRNDLLNSLNILPTGSAHLHLGDSYYDNGNRQQAAKHYAALKGVKGPAGDHARARLKTMGYK